jgi:hypothetical protein
MCPRQRNVSRAKYEPSGLGRKPESGLPIQLVAAEALEPIRRQRGVARRILDIAMRQHQTKAIKAGIGKALSEMLRYSHHC